MSDGRKLRTQTIAEGGVAWIEGGYYGCLTARKGAVEIVTYEPEVEGVPTDTLADLAAAVDRIRGGRNANRSRRKALTKQPPGA
ncbi:hypothetical protein [Botrimarina mediterranea]|uniref:hypothetical protein n=1 Tax=Botrimarina mediterranea TaxID=2528022 RepID=UPI00118AB217|nr:hypothetical protein K2D_16630 [Planctomycetes bacterium K2D]